MYVKLEESNYNSSRNVYFLQDQEKPKLYQGAAWLTNYQTNTNYNDLEIPALLPDESARF